MGKKAAADKPAATGAQSPPSKRLKQYEPGDGLVMPAVKVAVPSGAASSSKPAGGENAWVGLVLDQSPHTVNATRVMRELVPWVKEKLPGTLERFAVCKPPDNLACCEPFPIQKQKDDALSNFKGNLESSQLPGFNWPLRYI